MSAGALEIGGIVFLAGLATLALLLVRETRQPNSSNRNFEALALLLVSALCLGGFALADAGMNFSWTGHAVIGDRHWLELALAFIGALLVVHLLLRATKSSLDQVVLPAASVLALLGVITVFAWEARDANAYIATEGLPSMREYANRLAASTSLDERTEGEALNEAIPDETAYELDPAHRPEHVYATALNDDWVQLYNAAAQKFRTQSAGPAGSAPSPPSIRLINPYANTHRQVAAVVLALLLVPLWSSMFRAERLSQILAKRAFFVGAFFVLLLVTMTGVALSGGRVPSLPFPTDGGLNDYEVLSVFLAVFLASGLACCRGGPANAKGPLAVLLALGTAVTLILFGSRDFGGTVLLLLVTGALLILGAAAPWRRALLLGAAVGAIALGATLYLAPDAFSPAAQARIDTWRDPEAAFTRASESNAVGGSFQRIVQRRLGELSVAASPLNAGAYQTLASEVGQDVGSVLGELDWRLQNLQSSSTDGAKPFVPGSDHAQELLLAEADGIWGSLGGYVSRSAGGAGEDGPAARLASVKDLFSTALARFDVRVEAVERADTGSQPGTAAAAGPDEAVNTANLLSASPAADNFQLQRVDRAIEAGGPLGVGLGQGRPEAIPGVTEDAAFAALAEALGLVGAVIIVALLVIIVGRGLKRVPDGGPLGTALLMAGFSLIFALQAIVSVGGLIGLTPFTGISFPLISRGGTATVVDFLIVACIGSSAVVRAAAAEQSPLPARRPERLTAAQFGGVGLVASFSLLLLSLFVLQLGRRSPAPGAFLRSPSTNNGDRRVLDQWSGPLYYRAAPGPILDRNGQLLAQVRADGGGWSSPDPDLEASLGHIVQPLDTAIRDTLGESREPS